MYFLRVGGLFGRGGSVYKIADTGLFGGQKIQFGNNKPKSKHKTRRTWLPNIQTKMLYSEALDTMFKLKVTTRILRTIDKKGGLDQYLLGTKDKNIASTRGLEIKSQIKDALKKSKTLAGTQQPKILQG
ncbi:hypothetical protein H4219_003366 [Mycoemilia scoparia]|uniref:Large ribosomal subunit protein bL28m n=1 Tax=Mycoemilia scoparia TaxID=417184 RepID=A0A9W8DPD2_9FUNG|nr:hypothetical protein H4219_003366 [Mycoemilia scoparia]